MPVELVWLQPKRIIVEYFSGDLIIDEIKEMQRVFITWLDEGDPPVHYIGDFSQIKNFPKAIREIRSGLTYTGNPNLGWIVLVTNNNPVLNYFVSMITQMVTRNSRFKVCATLDDALAFLHKQDASLSFIKEKAEK